MLFQCSPESAGPDTCPMTVSLMKPDYKAITSLLYFGAQPKKLTLAEGDTPLHAAILIGLEKDKGTLQMHGSRVQSATDDLF